MKKIQYFVLCSWVILALSCSNNKEFVPIYKAQIDGNGDWINCNTIGKYWGYTGDYCSKSDSINQYTFGFSKLFSEISPNPIKKVKVSVWVKLSDLSKKSVLFISIDDSNNKNIFWSGHDLVPVVKEVNKWYKMEIEENISEVNTEGAKIGICVLNSNKDIVYVDDYEIQFFTE
ncbi:MAG TPA: hypothetical protein PKK00_05975 [Bacteroidales bacterium]|nr:hypothetical protein [Bacteroidales bacterium]HPS16821.1 hypothetical protein [Bacteroidales bacterium]